jgi:hypothetical protein
MDVQEIPVWEFIVSLGRCRLLVIDPRMPSAELGVAAQSDELVLVSRRRLMVAPVVPLIRNKLPLGDQVPGMVECRLVQSHSHGFVFSRGTEASTANTRPALMAVNGLKNHEFARVHPLRRCEAPFSRSHPGVAVRLLPMRSAPLSKTG